MTEKIKEELDRIRLERLKKLMGDAKQNAFAAEIGMEPSQLNQYWLGTRGIGELVARKIEIKKNLPKYWMDGEERFVSSESGSNLSMDILREFLEQLRPHDLSAREMAQIIVANYPEAEQNEKVNLQPSIRLVVNNTL